MKNRVIIISLAVLLLAAPFIRVILLKTFPSKESITLTIGTNAEYPPFSYIENNEIIGFDIDLVKEVGKRLNKNLKIVDMPFESLIPAGLIGKVQVVAAGMTYTDERSKRVLFTKPYIFDDPLLIVSLNDSQSKISSLEDLNYKRVIVNEGYTADLYISSLYNAQKMNLIRLNCPADGFMAITSNRGDAFITTRSTINHFMKIKTMDTQKYKISSIDDKNAHDEYSLVISKKHKYLLNNIEKTLEEMKEDGTIQKLKDKWNF